MPASLKGRNILITGGTSGVGKIAARELAFNGAYVVIIGRNEQKADATARELRFCACSPDIDYLVGDLSVQADVRRIASEYRQRYSALHVLINNAAGLFMSRQVSAEGLEMSLALNHLAYFTLTLELLDLLKASTPARIINVTSSSHRIARLKLNDLAMNKGYIGLLAYGRSKLMNVVFTYELARRLAGTGVTANCVHPGLIGSNLGSNNNGLYRPAFDIYHRVALSPERGAQPIIYLASAPELEGVSGRYYSHHRMVASSKSSTDPAAGPALWEVSLRLSQAVEDSQPAALASATPIE